MLYTIQPIYSWCIYIVNEIFFSLQRFIYTIQSMRDIQWNTTNFESESQVTFGVIVETNTLIYLEKIEKGDHSIWKFMMILIP